MSEEFGMDGETFKKVYTNTPDAVLIDVRSPVEFYEGTIPGAINVDYMAKDFESKVLLLDPTKTYFVFCRNGNRSTAARKAMIKKKMKVYTLTRGIRAWPF